MNTLNHPPICPSIHPSPIQPSIVLLSGSFLNTCSVSSHVLGAGAIGKESQYAEEGANLKEGLMTQKGDTTVGDAEMGEPTTTAHTVGPGHGVSQQALCCLDHDKDGSQHSLNPKALIISLRGLFLLSQREKNVHHPCTVRERRHGQEGKQVQEGDDNGSHKKTLQKFCMQGPLGQVEPIRSPEATRLTDSYPHAPAPILNSLGNTITGHLKQP